MTTKQNLPEIAEQAINEEVERLQRLTHKLSRDALSVVLEDAMSQFEKKTAEAIKQVRTEARAQDTIVGIQFEGKEVQKLSKPIHPLLPDVLKVLGLGLTPLLVGPAGSGKTFLGEQAAEALKLPYGHLCFSAGVSETWLFGRQTPTGFIEGEFSKLYKAGGLFLADELDAADPNLLLAINTALANGHLYNPISGENIKRHPDFHFIGTANTFGKGGNGVYTGRSRLDAATLDRFTVLEVTYLQQIEDVVCPNKTIANWLRQIRANVVSRNSSEVVSYRAFEKAFKLHRSGMKPKDIESTLFASWPDSVRSNCVVTLSAR